MERRIHFLKNDADSVHYKNIKKRVEEALLKIPLRRKKFLSLRAILFPLIYLAIYFLALVYREDPYLYYSLFAMMGLFSILIFLNLVHEAVHGSAFPIKWQNKAMLYFFDFIGANSYIWKKRHKVLHHGFQNVAGWDSDIEQASLFRIYPHDPPKSFHRYQHRMIFIFYPLYLFNWLFIRDFKDYFKKSQLIRKVVDIPLKQYFILFFFKFLFLGYSVLVPFALGVPFMRALTAMICMVILAGTFALFILLTPHVNTTNQFPLPNTDGDLPYSWLEHQFATTNDVRLNNWFTRNILGNFNFHIAHHLFPQISAAYSPEITEIIRSYALKNNLGYRSYSLKEALIYHYRLIRNNALKIDFFEEDM